MIEFVIQEPKFTDNPARCFKLPFIACETLSTENSAIEKSLFDNNEEAKSQNNDCVDMIQKPVISELSYFLSKIFYLFQLKISIFRF